MSDKTKPVCTGEVVSMNYKVLLELGAGGFGAVYEVVDMKTEQHYAMKVQLKKPVDDEPGLNLEVCVIRRLQTCPHVVRYIASGEHGPNRYGFVVMQLVGRNLADLRRSCPHSHFTIATSCRAALQCLDAIEAVHSSSLIHRDIKPANFAIGRSEKDCRTIFILDFGLVRRFRLKSGCVRKQRDYAGFRGTVKYASVNILRNIDAGRVDDVWSWFYMFVEFMKGELPWRVARLKKDSLDMKVSNKKEFMKGLSKEFDDIYDNLMIMRYADCPPYHWYRELIDQITRRNKVSSSEPFDWEQGGAAFEQTQRICAQPYQKQMKSVIKVIREKVEKTTNQKEESRTEKDINV